MSRLRKDIGSDTATPASKTTRYDYDTNDNLDVLTDAKGEKSSQEYDALNRLIEQIDPDADNTILTDNPRVKYTYDTQDRLDTVTDQEGLVTDYDYNTWGDLIR